MKALNLLSSVPFQVLEQARHFSLRRLSNEQRDKGGNVIGGKPLKTITWSAPRVDKGYSDVTPLLCFLVSASPPSASLPHLLSSLRSQCK
jgi:hypothetical protein